MNKLFQILALSLFCQLQLIAQQPARYEDYWICTNVDSLESVVHDQSEDPLMYMHALIRLELSRYNYPNKFGKYIENIHRIATEQRSDLGVAMYQFLQGINFTNSDKAAAADYFLKAKERFESRKDTVGIMQCYSRLLLVYCSRTWENFGDSFTKIHYYEKIKVLGENGSSPYAKLLGYRAFLIYEHDLKGNFNLETEEKIFYSALQIIDQNPQYEFYRDLFYTWGGTSYYRAKNYKKLLSVHLKVYESYSKPSVDRVVFATNVANAYYLLHNFAASKQYILEAIELGKNQKDLDLGLWASCYSHLANAAFHLKNYNEAWEYRAVADSLQTEIHGKSISRNLIEVQTKYETEKKEAENRQLLLEKEQKIRENKYLSLFLAIVGVGLLLLLFLFHKIRGQNKTLQRLNQNIETQKKDLAASNQRMSYFTHALSHDALGYLNDILNYANLGQNLAAGTPAENILQRIHRSTNRLKKMSLNLIEYNKGQQMGQPERFDLNVIVTEVIEDIDSELSTASVKTMVGELPCVYADREFVKQVFKNLMGNAVKFRRADVPLVIEIAAQASYTQPDFIEVQIKDNGMGIEAEKLPVIFNEFTKGDRSAEGSGLGLYICRQILENFGGRIWATSEEGKGSVFGFTLPAAGQ